MRQTILLFALFLCIHKITIAQPVISSFSPTTGPVGTTVTITGNNFSPTAGSNAVYFGAVKATVVSATVNSLTVTVPVGATCQPISVTAGQLTGYSNLSFVTTFPGGASAFVAQSFATKIDYTALSGNRGITLADFDGDGKADIASQSQGSVSIFRNTSTAGTLSFATRLDFTGADGPGIAIGDFNNDSLPDIVSNLSSTNGVVVYRNTSTTGNISFTAVSLISDFFGRGVALSDFNGDGKLDLIMANGTGNSITIIPNNSTPSSIAVLPRITIALSQTPSAIAASDLDDDGKPDFAVTLEGSSAVAVFRNTSSGGTITFAANQNFAVGSTPKGICIADIDQDGKTDLAVTNSGGTTVSILKNTSSSGTISFNAALPFTTGNSPHGVSAGDLNGDGKPDLAISNYSSNTVSVLKNTTAAGVISFAAREDYGTNSNPYGNCIGDLDGDNKPDLIVANYFINMVSVLRSKVNEPTITSFTPNNAVAGTLITINGVNFTGATAVSFGGTAATSFTVVNDNLITATVAAGASGDVSVTTQYGTATMAGFIFYTAPPPGITSLSTLSGNIGSTLTITGSNFSTTPANNIVYFGAVKATVTAATANSLTVTVPVAAGYGPVSVTTNNLTAYSNQFFNIIFPNAVAAFGPTSFSQGIEYDMANGPYNVAQTDIDGDGKIDVIVTTGSSVVNVSVFRNTSSTSLISFAPRVEFYTGPANGVAIGDLDGDGKPDLAFTGGNSVTVVKNTSTTGSISFATPLIFPTSTESTNVAIGDLDGDGKPDIVTSNTDFGSGTTVSVLRNTTTGAGISFIKTNYTTGAAPKDVKIADIDSDGKPDVITSNGTGNSISVLRNTSTTFNISLAAKVDFTTGQNPQNLAVGDLDNDGKIDVAVANYGVFPTMGNTVSVLRNTSTSGNIAFAAKVDLNSTTSPTGIAIADFDGEGKPDIALVNNMNPAFLGLFKNNSTTGNISFATMRDYPATTFAQKITTGDINGDGLIDITAVTSNQFLIFRNQVTTDPALLTVPAITAISPVSGAVGSSVTITGTFFGSTPAANVVYFGGAKATVTAASTTSLTVTVPAGATYGPISVTKNNLTGYSTRSFNVTFAGGNAPFNANLFFPKFDSATSEYPNGIAAADFDGDGKLDVVSANTNANTVSVYRNTSATTNISFAAKTDFPAGNGPQNIATGDINGDGKLDIVVSSFGVNVLLNTSTSGNISFAAPVNLNAGAALYIKVADWDEDGRPDIAFTYPSGTSLSVYRNTSINGTISFYRVNEYYSGNAPNNLAFGQLNNDSKPDIVVTNGGQNNISIFRNMSVPGMISFSTIPLYLPSNDNPYGVATGDLDNDGLDDIAFVNYFDSTLSIYRNTNSSSFNFSFASRENFRATRSVYSIAIGDLNGDNKPDVATTNFNDSSLSVFKNLSTTGTISFDTKADYATGQEPVAIIVADLNNDGKPDVATANRFSNTISVLRNNSNRPVITNFTPALVNVGNTVTITGFNFTGATSVSFGGVPAASYTVVNDNTITAIVGEGSNGNVSVTNPQGTGTAPGFSFKPPVITSFTPLAGPAGTVVTITGNNFSPTAANNIVYFGAVRATVTAATPTSLTVNAPMGTSYQPISVTTFNHTACATHPFIVTFGSNHTGFTTASFGTRIDSIGGNNSRSVAVGDINNDGKPDIIAANTYSDSVSVFLNTTTGTGFSLAANVDFLVGSRPYFVNVSDIDGDGKQDLSVANHDGTITILRNTTTGNNVSFTKSDFGLIISSDVFTVAVGDLNADGKPDIATAEDLGEGILIYRNTSTPGNVSFQYDQRIPSISSWYVAISDLNDDGKPDLVMTDYLDRMVRLFPNNSTGGAISFGTPVVINLSQFAVGIAIGDLDRDGKPDVAVANGGITANYISVMRNTSPNSSSFAFGNPQHISVGPNRPNSVAIGDLDGDGKPEMITGSQNTDSISVFKNMSSTGTITFSDRVNYQTVFSPYGVTTGDLDGDSKLDIISGSIFSPNNGAPGYVSIFLNKIVAFPTGVPNVDPSALSLQAFPNPFTSTVYIRAGKTLNNVEFKLMDLNGRVLRQESYKRIQANTTIDLQGSSLPPGVYIINMQTAAGNTNIKLVKM